jgi:hypothetical protein
MRRRFVCRAFISGLALAAFLSTQSASAGTSLAELDRAASAPESGARLCFIRTSHSALSVWIEEEGQEIVRLRPNSWACRDVSAGGHDILGRSGGRTIEVPVRFDLTEQQVLFVFVKEVHHPAMWDVIHQVEMTAAARDVWMRFAKSARPAR